VERGKLLESFPHYGSGAFGEDGDLSIETQPMAGMVVLFGQDEDHEGFFLLFLN